MKKLLFAALFALMFVLGACGSNGEEGATDDNTNEQTDQSTDESTDEGMDENAEEGNAEGEGTDSSEEGTVDAAAAEKAFQTNCSSCHGGDLGGGFGPALTEVGSKYSAEDIVGIIHNGKGKMPKQSSVKDEDAELIASWLATMK